MNLANQIREYNKSTLEILKNSTKRIFKISVTDLQDIKRCPRRYYFSSYNELGLDLKIPNPKQAFGHYIHKALELYYKDEIDPILTFTNQWNEFCEANLLGFQDASEFIKLKELGIGMLDGYLKRWILEKEYMEVIAVEQEIYHIIYEDEDLICVLCGKIDLILKSQAGHYTVVDHKTTTTINDDFAEWDNQLKLYCAMLKRMFPEETFIQVYNLLKKKLPTEPNLLKNGGLSKARNIDTTYEVYLATLNKNNIPLEGYLDFLAYLKSKPNDFYQRKTAYFDNYDILLRNIRDEIYLWAHIQEETLEAIYTPTRECNWDCSFCLLCKGLQKGESIDHIIKMKYIKRSDH